MINKAFFENAHEVAEARGISVEDVYEVFKKGLINSFKKKNGNTSCKVIINPEKNEILLYAVFVVVSEYSLEQDPEGIKEILLEDAKKIKSSYKVGDIIEIAFGQKTVKVRVLDIVDTTKKEQAKDLFEYIA